MKFVSAQDYANRLQVSIRTVQKWAKEGKLPGAKKVGRDWMIPIEKTVDESMSEKKFVSTLLNLSFELGKADSVYENIIDEDEKNLVLAEYYLYTGDKEKATEIAERYLDYKNHEIQYLAALICLVSNMSLGRINVANFSFDIIKNDLFDDLLNNEVIEEKAFGVFIASAVSALLQLPIDGKPMLSKYLMYLPDGLKAFSCYILAVKAYLARNYDMSYGIANTALYLYGDQYPLPAIYLNLICAIDKMNLLKLDRAEEHVRKAYEIAEKDQFIEVFGEKYSMLHAYIEKMFKYDHPEVYDRIIQIAKSFNKGWILIHNKETNANVSMNLTPIETTIAMLFNRNWKIKEIAYHMDMSERTIKNHLAIIYEKLDISSRKELKNYLMR